MIGNRVFQSSEVKYKNVNSIFLILGIMKYEKHQAMFNLGEIQEKSQIQGMKSYNSRQEHGF